MQIKANCKINIGLDVLRKREDGYHDLSTVMIPVKGLYDVVEVEPTEGDKAEFLSLGLKIDCADEDNICVKAHSLMQERYGIGGVRITLDKRIPFGAGLGGGSADGTVVILAINQIFGLSLTEQELIDIAAQLGSDTAFFVRNTPQLCEGRGEVMTPIALPQLSGKWIVLIKPDEGVSTREAYAGIRLSDGSDLSNVSDLSALLSRAVNDFEQTVFPLHPEIGVIKQRLLDAGAVYAAMSGSGSTVFGLFTTPSTTLPNAAQHDAERSADTHLRMLHEEFASMIIFDDTL